MSLPSVRIDPGTAVGPYLVERSLSPTGGSSRYIARGDDGERVVVELFARDPGTGAARARLLREIRALAAIEHRHLARVRASGEQEGRPWIASEYVQGTDLARVLAERGPQSVEAAVGYLIQAAEGLVAAHGAGLVHRDLGPSKIRVARDGRVVVVGFGIAARRPEAREGGEAVEPSAATPYVAPEQIEHDLADERSDVWALGCVLYELLAGDPPFGRGGHDTTAAILRDEPQWSERVAGPIVHVVSACLRKSSFARVGSARELLGLLRDAAESPSAGPALEANASSTRRASARPSARPSAPPFAGAMMRPSSPARPPSVPRVAPVAARLGSHPPSRPPARVASFPPSIPASFPPSIPSSLAPPIPPSFPPSMPPTVPPPGPPSWVPGGSRPPPAPGRVKGTAIRAGLAWYAATYGPPVLARIAALASPELKGTLRLAEPDFGIMPSGWYDTAVIGELIDLLDRAATPVDPESLLAKLAQSIARDNVTGVYRSLFRLVSSPAMLEAHAQRVWRTYIDEGTLTVVIAKPGSFEARVTGWTRHDVTVCRFVRPMLEHLLRAVGYTALVVDRTQCVSDGAPFCVFEGAWVP